MITHGIQFACLIYQLLKYCITNLRQVTVYRQKTRLNLRFM